MTTVARSQLPSQCIILAWANAENKRGHKECAMDSLFLEMWFHAYIIGSLSYLGFLTVKHRPPSNLMVI